VTKSGRFIVLEGLEGAGKSTAIKTIYDYLFPRVPEIITTREPGGTHVGETVRSLVKATKLDEPLDARAELLLFYAARVQLLNHIILPALSRGAWVVADRFELSTYAYQGGGRQLDLNMIQHLSNFCLGDLEPDLTIFLELSPELGLERACLRGKKDRIEDESMSFFKNVHASYHQHLKRFRHVQIIDASQSLDTVQSTIINTLEQYMNIL
jgi:dTMP kinase